MLYRLFNTNTVFTISVIVILTILFWIPAFFVEPATALPLPVSPGFGFIVKLLGEFKIISGIAAIGLMVLGALLLNSILDDYDVLPKNSSMGAFVYILIMSGRHDLVYLNPALFSNLFLIISLGQLFRIYGKQDTFAPAFNTGFFIALASLFYFPAILMFILVPVSLIVYRQFSWREWFISVIGLILPYAFLATWYFWNDVLFIKYGEYLNSLKMIDFRNLTFNTYFYIQAGFIAILMMLSFFRMIGALNEKQIRIRKAYSILIWFVFLGLGVFLFSGNYSFPGYCFFMLPAAAMISGYLLLTKKALLAELILILLSVSLIVGRFL